MNSDPALHTPSDPALTLTTLGAMRLHSAEEPRLLLGPGKPLALFVYLHCAPRHSANREHLLELFWRDLEPERARHALRQLLYSLRQTLGEGVIDARDHDLVLTVRVASDRDEFLEAITAGQLGWAVGRYGGDFLPRFACPGGAEFEHWADLERDRLRTLFIRAAESVARDLLSRGRYRDAQAVARRIRETRPDDQSGWRLLIEACLGARDRVHAIAEAEALEAHFSAEARELEPATRSLLRQLRQESSALADHEDPCAGLMAELVGREREFSAVLETWSAARHAPCRHIHVSSSAGLGKTRLMNDVAIRLRAMGVRFVHLRASPGERALPFAFAGDMAHALASLPGAAAISPASMSALVSLHPALSSRFSTAPFTATGGEALRLRTMAAAEAIQILCEEAPMALLIDDLHWIDDDSFRLLEGVLSRNAPARLLVVTTARPMRDRRLQLSHSEELLLEPLTPAATRDLLASLGALPASEWAEVLPVAVHGAGRGSPLEILETLRLAIDRGSLVLDELGWQTPDPQRLLDELKAGQAIRTRIERLDPESRWVLLTLATAGSPLTRAELGRLVRHGEGLDATLGDLERRGFIHRVGDGVELAHDAIGEVTVVCESAERRRAADAAVGRMLAGGPADSLAVLVRAGRHLQRGGDVPGLRGVFTKLVEGARAGRDQRRVEDLAHELSNGNETAAQDLVSSLSFTQRFGIRKRPAILAAVAAAAVIVTALAVTAGTRAEESDQVLLLAELGGWLSKPVLEIPLRLDDWRNGSEIDLESMTRKPARRESAGAVSWITTTPDGEGWLYGVETGDSNTVDVMLDYQGKSLQRILAGPRDDSPGPWLPDGTGFIGWSARWSPPGADDYDGLAYSLADGSIRPITNSRNHEHQFHPSPDGTRIAFVRRFRSAQSPELCWTTFDASMRERCIASDGSGTVLVGWAGLDNLVVLRNVGTVRELLALNLRTEAFRRLEDIATAASASPDGNWIAVHAQREGAAFPAWYVYPALAPERARPLALGNRSFRHTVSWGNTADRRYLDSLTIIGPDSIEPGTTMRYRADGRDAKGKGHPIAVPITWSLSDTSLATIDSAGALSTKGSGILEVTASAGGWRQASKRVQVRGLPFRLTLREDWREALESRWIPFGEPRPAVIEGPDNVRAFWNNGDGSFDSGAYSRFVVAGPYGLGLEAMVSTPITRDQWQRLTIALVGGLSAAAMKGWDHRSGSGPSISSLGSDCAAVYPADEGDSAPGWILLSAGGQPLEAPAPASLKSGAWHRIRLQIFPDGTCGLALDGEPLLRSSAPLDLDQPFAIRLGNTSANTKVLIGPLEVWEGIRPDVDWNALRRR